MNPLTEIQTRIESMVYEKQGRKFIDLGNYALDFKKDYLFLGFTKSGSVILGDIVSYSYNGSQEQIKKRIGKIYDNRIHAEGCRYIESIPTLEEIKGVITA